MEFKEVLRWKSDSKPESTEAKVLVSKCGKVIKRLPYKKWCKPNNSYSMIKGHIYKYTTNRGKEAKLNTNNKYLHVNINGKAHTVHRLVALAWIPNPLNKPQVNHKDGNKQNNHVDNLEWVTNLENRRHAIKNNFPRKNINKIHDSDMPKIKQLRDCGKTLKEIAELYNVTYECIRWRLKKYDNK